MSVRPLLFVFASLPFLTVSTASAQYEEDPHGGPALVEVEDEYEYEYEVPEAPVYEVSTPGYDPYGYGQQRPHRPRRYRIPYQEGMEIPPGGQIVKRRKLGLAIPGAVLFAIPYFATVGIWSADAGLSTRYRVSGAVAVPVFGPFIAMAIDGRHIPSGRKFGLAMSGLMQLGGVTMLVFGLIGRDYLVYYADVKDRRLAFQLLPIASHDGGGAALHMSF